MVEKASCAGNDTGAESLFVDYVGCRLLIISFLKAWCVYYAYFPSSEEDTQGVRIFMLTEYRLAVWEC